MSPQKFYSKLVIPVDNLNNRIKQDDFVSFYFRSACTHNETKLYHLQLICLNLPPKVIS